MLIVAILTAILAHIAFVIAPAARLKANGGGVSIFPGIPLFPVVGIAIIFVLRLLMGSSGLLLSIGIHLTLLLSSTIYIVYWLTRVRGLPISSVGIIVANDDTLPCLFLTVPALLAAIHDSSCLPI